MTAGVWQRGILAAEYGVPVGSVHWYTGAIEGSHREEKIPLDPPPEISVTPIPPGRMLSAMPADGEIEAICSATQPCCFGREPQVRHLFEDFKQVEKDYHRRTGIFPIMHTVVIRREIHRRHPSVARALTKAFEESLGVASEDLTHRGR